MMKLINYAKEMRQTHTTTHLHKQMLQDGEERCTSCGNEREEACEHLTIGV